MTLTGTTDASAVDADAVSSNPHTARVCAALDHTRRLGAYADILMATRTHGNAEACGSTIVVYGHEGDGSPVDVELTERAIRTAQWKPAQHPAVMDGCSAFRAEIHNPIVAGFIGLASIDHLINDNEMVRLEDQKDTGFVEAVFECVGSIDYAQRASDVWIILGPAGTAEGVYTFHPGEPIAPSRIYAHGNVGRVVTAMEAKEMGFAFAKLREAVKK